MKKLPFILLMLTMVALTCLSAFAADVIPAHTPSATEPVFGAALQGFLQGTVFPIITALVLGLVSLVLNRLGQKYKIQALTERNNFLSRLAAQGVALAEERAAKLAGSVSKLSGSQKLDIAVAHLMSFAPSIKPEQAQNIVHSVLAQIPGAGATGEAITLVPQDGIYSMLPPGEALLPESTSGAKPPAHE
jgi:hypothetical protein